MYNVLIYRLIIIKISKRVHSIPSSIQITLFSTNFTFNFILKFFKFSQNFLFSLHKRHQYILSEKLIIDGGHHVAHSLINVGFIGPKPFK